jgi:hypothetical protein
MAFDDTNFDPVRYGVLWQKVEDYERRFDQMDKKMDKMEHQLEQLVGLANQSKGGFWVGMSIASGVGGLIGWLANHLKP